MLVNRAGKEIKRLSESDILAQAAKWAANARDVVAEKSAALFDRAKAGIANFVK